MDKRAPVDDTLDSFSLAMNNFIDQMIHIDNQSLIEKNESTLAVSHRRTRPVEDNYQADIFERMVCEQVTRGKYHH